jgi:hypothetical protein
MTMYQETHHFSDINIGNVITWIVVVVAWLLSRLQDWWSAKQRISSLEEWRNKHETETIARERLLTELEKACVRLATLAEAAERRLQMLEEHERRG